MFHVEMLPAGHGDCLLVEYGEPPALHRILIDAGPYTAFEECAARIDALASSGLRFELLVVTHIDTDHIDGAVKLLDAPPAGIDLGDVWFNGWRHLRPERCQSTDQADLLGPLQGEMLSALILEHGLPWNAAFGGCSVSTGESSALPKKELDGGLTLTLLSPRPEELLALESTWEDNIHSQGFDPGSREAALKALTENARYHKPADLLGEKTPEWESLRTSKFREHRTESNASSIAFLAEYNGKTSKTSCLFAADAQPRTLAASIERLLQERGEKRLHVDAVKVSHHGSRGNTSPTLLHLLDCRHFLVSTNGAGKPHHPHDETIVRIVDRCGPGAHFWFNYVREKPRIWDDEELIEQYNYTPHYPEKGQQGLVVPLSEM